MISTLFFDESDSNTVLHVRSHSSRPQPGLCDICEDMRHLAHDSPVAERLSLSYYHHPFETSGTVEVPALHTTVLWWLDPHRVNQLYLLAVNDDESVNRARNSQSRMLTVELPLGSAFDKASLGTRSGALLACGVTKLPYGGHCIAVAWVSTTLEVGYIRVTLQRDTDAHGTLLLTPEGRVVEGIVLDRIQRALGRRQGLALANMLLPYPAATAGRDSALAATPMRPGEDSEGTAKTKMSGGEGGLCACVVSEVPAECRDTAVLFVVMNGFAVWQAQLYMDGRVEERAFRDDPRREELARRPQEFASASLFAHSSNRQGTTAYHAGQASEQRKDKKGWLDRLLPSNIKTKKCSNGVAQEMGVGHRYVAVTAVLNSPYVVLLRWNGILEVYDHNLVFLDSHPMCQLPLRELAAALGDFSMLYPIMSLPRVQQYASLHMKTNAIHVLTCFGSQEGRRCVWSRLPHVSSVSTEEMVVGRCSYSLAPPTMSSTPIGCSVDATERLAVLWDLGAEEDAHLLCSCTIRSILQPTRGASGILQLLEGCLSAGHEWQWSSTRTYLCLGGRHLSAVTNRGDHVVLLERRHDYHRAHVVQSIDHWLGHLIEGNRVHAVDSTMCIAGVTAQEPAERFVPPRALCLVSVCEETGQTAALQQVSFCAALWEGWDALQYTAHGFDDLVDVFCNAMNLPLSGQMPSVPRLLSEATLAGYAPSGTISVEAVREAIHQCMALSSAETASQQVLGSPTCLPLFCGYSRHYLLHAVLRELFYRVAFLTLTYIGWVGSSPASHINPVTDELTRAIAFLSAAHHAARVAGPELAHLAEASAAGNDSATMVVLILRTFTTDATGLAEVTGHPFFSARFALQVAARLYRGGSARLVKAATAWATQLQHYYPILQHYSLLHDLHSGRTTRGLQQLALCQTVCSSLSAFIDASGSDIAALLLDADLLMSDDGPDSAWRTLLQTREHREVLRLWIRQEPALAPKLYAIGVLRCLVPSASLTARAPASVIHRYYLVELLLVLQRVRSRTRQGQRAHHCGTSDTDLGARTTPSEGSGRSLEITGMGKLPVVVEGEAVPALPFAALQFALEELRIETLLCLAHVGVACADFGGCFNDLEDAYDMAGELDTLQRYAEAFHSIIGRIVETACQSEHNIEAFLSTPNTIVRLDELVVNKWYNYIARLPTKSTTGATESLRYRAIMGLYRYLMCRHSYAQCGRVMSDLASLLRCSPLRRSAEASIMVGDLVAMALHAVELISPSGPMLKHQRQADDVVDKTGLNESPLFSGFAWRPEKTATIEVAPSYVDRLLSPHDLPWLRRRVYQAHCERKLWQRGSMVDCTGLWVDGAPSEDLQLGVQKLLAALMEAKLWSEAHRFAALAGADACGVLEQWAVHLIEESDSTGIDNQDTDNSVVDEWHQIIERCAEESTLDNQYMGYRRVLQTALALSYAKTLPDLRDAHRAADPYSAMTTLLAVFHMNLARAHQTNSDGEGEDKGTAAAFREAQAWLPWVDAARIAIDFCADRKQKRRSSVSFGEGSFPDEGEGVERQSDMKVLTAGTLDPLSRYGKELLQRPDVLKHLQCVDAESVARQMLAVLSF